MIFKMLDVTEPNGNIHWIIEKARKFQKKKIYFSFIDYAKAFDKVESRLPGEISITSDMQMTPPLWQKAKRN